MLIVWQVRYFTQRIGFMVSIIVECFNYKKYGISD